MTSVKVLQKLIDKMMDMNDDGGYDIQSCINSADSLLAKELKSKDVPGRIVDALEDVCATNKVGWIQEQALKDAKTFFEI
ncbi:MAG: hypothetical protein PF904_00210 [Kiritimatiellae bacterium]|jgi:hypothetical protein|nr:hypothetical protein [Kiritimatiellia bacterium]